LLLLPLPHSSKINSPSTNSPIVLIDFRHVLPEPVPVSARYDTQVLKPLHAAEVLAARQRAEALAAAQAAQAEAARQAAIAAQQAAQAALVAQQQQEAAATAKAAQTARQTVTVASSGSCVQWLQQAGVTDIANAVNLINRESGCNPYAQNKSSGACGIGQDIRGCEVGYDPVAQIQWMLRYVNNRYGGFTGAWQHELSFLWY
jgi:hypothetical protein